MSTFTTPLVLTPTAVAPGTIIPIEAIPFIGPVLPIGQENLDVRWIDGRNWAVLDQFDFASEVLERIVIIPVGFVTDFASIPRFLWSLLPPTGPYGKIAVVHDLLYRTASFRCTRLDADRTLLEGMIALHVPWWTREVVFAGVRVGGSRSFKQRS